MTYLGDAMLLGLSNVLCQQIIVFTSIPSWPHFTIYPRSIQISENPIYLTCGHYSYAFKESVPQSTNSTQPVHNDFFSLQMWEEEMQKKNHASTVARINHMQNMDPTRTLCISCNCYEATKYRKNS